MGERMRIKGAIVLACVLAAPAALADYATEWGPPVGERLPVLEARDHTGALQNLESLALENGLLIFLNRSADW